ncbi:MAG: HD domain-containing protein [Planctomycetes bacterium]|nr:HD domain-containing protein [Planctomycetota bacterium]
MEDGLFSFVLEKALRLAAVKHRDQLRKASELPYFYHPAAVAVILARAGFGDERVLAAAVLHDVVEDTDCTLAELERERFPPDIIAFVAAHTEQKLDGAGNKRPWKVRKDEHLEHVAAAPLEARAMVLADKLHNLGTMLYDLEHTPGFWSHFNASPEYVVWYHQQMIEKCDQGDDPRLKVLADECRSLLAQLQSRIDAAS